MSNPQGKDLFADNLAAVALHILSVRLEHVVVRDSRFGGITAWPIYNWDFLQLWKADLQNVVVTGCDPLDTFRRDSHDGGLVRVRRISVDHAKVAMQLLLSWGRRV